MKIGIIAPALPPVIGGMEQLAHGLANALTKLHEVTVFTLPGLGPLDYSYKLVDKLPEQRRLCLTFLKEQEENIDIWLGMQADLSVFAEKLRAPFFVYCHGNDFLNPLSVSKFVRILGLIISKIPYIWRYTSVIKSRLAQRTLSKALKNVRHIFINSNQMLIQMNLVLKIPKSNVTVIPPGVDDSFFQKRESSRGKCLKILTVSRLNRSNRRKNIDGVLKALPMLNFPVKYTIIGDGDDKHYLELLSKKLRIEDQVVFTGAISHNKLLEFYRQSDVFVLASKATKIDIEGFGIVYLEASASGVPVIASREGGSCDAIHEGRNGFVILSSESVDIAKGLSWYWENQDHFSADEVRNVAKKYQWAKIAEMLSFQIQQKIKPGG